MCLGIYTTGLNLPLKTKKNKKTKKKHGSNSFALLINSQVWIQLLRHKIFSLDGNVLSTLHSINQWLDLIFSME